MVKYKSVAITNSPGTIRKDIKMLATTKQRILKIFLFHLLFHARMKIESFLEDFFEAESNCSGREKFDSLNF